MKSQERSGVFPPISLGDMVGHAGAVRRLRRRFADNRHQTALLLYGPKGVGKATLARAYVRALLCSGLREDRSLPCGKCEACNGFQAGVGNLDFLEFDAQTSADATYVREFLKTAPFGQRRVVLAKKFDLASPSFVDALLKPLEEGDEDGPKQTGHGQRPVLIFLASDLRGVRQAGQSRCQIERLRALEGNERAELCGRVFGARSISFSDETARKLVLAGCRGLPGVLVAAANAIKVGEFVTAAELRRALGFDWVDAAIDYFGGLLGSDEYLPKVQFGEVETGVATARMRLIWAHLAALVETGRSNGSSEGVMLSVNPERMRSLADLLIAKADAISIQPRELWSTVAECLLVEGYADQAGFAELVTALEDRLHRPRLPRPGLESPARPRNEGDSGTH